MLIFIRSLDCDTSGVNQLLTGVS